MQSTANRLKKNNIISTDAKKKKHDKIQHPFIIKTLNKQENPHAVKGYIPNTYSTVKS